jgi:hypothetical protein
MLCDRFALLAPSVLRKVLLGETASISRFGLEGTLGVESGTSRNPEILITLLTEVMF